MLQIIWHSVCKYKINVLMMYPLQSSRYSIARQTGASRTASRASGFSQSIWNIWNILPSKKLWNYPAPNCTSCVDAIKCSAVITRSKTTRLNSQKTDGCLFSAISRKLICCTSDKHDREVSRVHREITKFHLTSLRMIDYANNNKRM